MEENKRNEKLTNYEKAINEVLNENIDIQSQGVEAEKLGAEKTNFDKTNDMLLKYYNEKTGTDFQEQLKAEINVDVHKSIEGKIQSQMDGERDEQIRDIEKELQGEEVLDGDMAKRAIKDAKEKSKSGELDVADIKAEVMKLVYLEAFEKYSRLLEDCKKRQLRNESMTIGDKEGTELVLYERYLANLEKKYAGYAQNKGLDIKKMTDDPEIKEKRKALEEKMKEMTGQNELDVQRNIERIKELAEKRNKIAEEMTILARNMDYYDPEEFKYKMDEYQKEYINVSYEINSLNPTLWEYEEQIEIQKENEAYYAREVGISYDGIEGGSLEEIEESKTITDENIAEVYKTDEKITDVIKEEVDDLIERAEKAFNIGDLDAAIECIEAAQIQLGISTDPTLRSHADKPERNEQEGPMLEGLEGVNSMEDTIRSQKIRESIDELKELSGYEAIEKTQEAPTMARVRRPNGYNG